MQQSLICYLQRKRLYAYVHTTSFTVIVVVADGSGEQVEKEPFLTLIHMPPWTSDLLCQPHTSPTRERKSDNTSSASTKLNTAHSLQSSFLQPGKQVKKLPFSINTLFCASEDTDQSLWEPTFVYPWTSSGLRALGLHWSELFCFVDTLLSLLPYLTLTFTFNFITRLLCCI